MASIEIHLSAEHLVRRHGRDAWAQAVAGAEACAASGDWEQVGYWRQIGGVVRSLEQRRGVMTTPRRALQGGENPAFG